MKQERMTLEEMELKYPNQARKLGLTWGEIKAAASR